MSSDELASVFAEDRSQHASVPPVGTPEYGALRARDTERRARADRILAELEGGASAEDLFHAAWLFNHGDDPAEARRAHELSRTEPQPPMADAPAWLKEAVARCRGAP